MPQSGKRILHGFVELLDWWFIGVVASKGLVVPRILDSLQPWCWSGRRLQTSCPPRSPLNTFRVAIEVSCGRHEDRLLLWRDALCASMAHVVRPIRAIKNTSTVPRRSVVQVFLLSCPASSRGGESCWPTSHAAIRLAAAHSGGQALGAASTETPSGSLVGLRRCHPGVLDSLTARVTRARCPRKSLVRMLPGEGLNGTPVVKNTARTLPQLDGWCICRLPGSQQSKPTVDPLLPLLSLTRDTLVSFLRSSQHASPHCTISAATVGTRAGAVRRMALPLRYSTCE